MLFVIWFQVIGFQWFSPLIFFSALALVPVLFLGVSVSSAFLCNVYSRNVVQLSGLRHGVTFLYGSHPIPGGPAEVTQRSQGILRQDSSGEEGVSKRIVLWIPVW